MFRFIIQYFRDVISALILFNKRMNSFIAENDLLIVRIACVV